MRKVTEKQLKIGLVSIENIQTDMNCRDEIPQLLLGLQTIYSNKQKREEVFAILEKMIPDDVDPGNGRLGMELWKILVLGTLRLNCNWDYDKLHDIANNHGTVRQFLGHSYFEIDQRYALQTLKDNIGLFTPEILDEISQAVVNTGQDMVCEDNDIELNGRCDSFVVETDVHYPTDINLLLDAVRKLRYSTAKDKAKRAKRAQLIIDAHRHVDLVELYVLRAKESIGILNEMCIGRVATIMLIKNYIIHAERQIDQIRRRVLDGEKIPHNEKVFSIFEEHTEGINKGKAGVPQELGLGVCILEDQYGFVLHHHVMEHQKDVGIAFLMVSAAKRKFAGLSGCSFDKGFYSPGKREELRAILDQVVLPKKGKLSKKDKRIEYSEEFIESRRKHSAVESAINALKNHALDRFSDHGLDGFKRYVALAVLARNIQILGAKVRQKTLKRLKRRKRSSSVYRLAA